MCKICDKYIEKFPSIEAMYLVENCSDPTYLGAEVYVAKNKILGVYSLEAVLNNSLCMYQEAHFECIKIIDDFIAIKECKGYHDGFALRKVANV